ncbi:MAG: lamin tail domain-containing protein [Candidatus Doudnabacteria bacterium]|nr:lamin tail domain-containing protein [Candidatus Doudnabacteria bacterium]
MFERIKGFVCALLVITGCWFVASSAKAEGEPNHIVISQVQIEGDAANDEFVEIYNPTDGCITLDGWSLQYKSSSGNFPLTTANRKNIPKVIMPAHTYYLIGGSLYNGAALADATNTNFSLSGSAAGATIFLVSSSAAVAAADDISVVDKFGYGTSADSALLVPTTSEKPAVDWAFMRTFYTNNNLGDFQVGISDPRNFLASAAGLSCNPPPSDGQNNDASTTPENVGGSNSTTTSSTIKSLLVKIYKFLPNPAGEDVGSEWVEIKNLDSQEINLDGWLLDDKNSGTGPAADALALSGNIAAGEIKRFVLPLEAFALNNSGGDEVNLYFSDKTLADTAAYSVVAYDDGVFEFRDNIWQPPTISSGSSGSSGSSSSGSAVSYLGSSNFKINEVFANPAGDDAGSEWVEIYNSSSATSSLNSYYLADGDSESWTSSAYAISAATSVPPTNYFVVLLPKDSLSLNNTGKEKVKLFNPQKQLIDIVEYSDSPENRSWAKDQNGKWLFGLPTKGINNNLPPPQAQVVISEILPAPTGDQDEFVELYNAATTTTDLSGFVLKIGTREKVMAPGTQLSPNAFLVILADDLPVALRNAGQDLSLYDAYGRNIFSISYPKAQAGESYARSEAGDFFWTGSQTPGETNQIVLAASDVVSAKLSAENVKTTVTAKSFSEYNKLAKENKSLSDRVVALESQIGELALAITNRQESPGVEQNEPVNNEQVPAAPKSPLSSYKYLVLAILALVFLIVLIKKYLFSPNSKV